MAEEKKGGTVFDVNAFWSRLENLFNNWQRGSANWSSTVDGRVCEADVFVLVTGKGDDDLSLIRTLALQNHLFGYAVPAATFVFIRSTRTLHVIVGQKPARAFEGLGSSFNDLTLKVHLKGETPEKDGELVCKLIRETNKSAVVGHLDKESTRLRQAEDKISNYPKRMYNAFRDNSLKVNVDVSKGVGACLQIKDSAAIQSMKQAAKVTVAFMKNYALPYLQKYALSYMDGNDKGITHSALSDKIVNKIVTAEENDNVLKLSKEGIDLNEIEECYAPIVMSNDEYNLSPSAVSNDNKITYGSVIMALGCSYRSYCSNIARTSFIDPTDRHAQVYAIVQECINAALAAMTPGSKVNSVYEAVNNVVTTKDPSLLNKLVKDCGAGIGLEFRESGLILSNKNATQFAAGMVINLSIGFSGVEPSPPPPGQPRQSPFAVLVADTYLITANGPELLTKGVSSAYKDCIIEEEEEDAEPDESERLGRGARNKKDLAAAINAEEERRKKMMDIAREKAEEARRRLENKEIGGKAKTDKAGEVVAYESPEKFPASAKPNRIHIDSRAEALLVPLNGQLVPFHISHIKNVHKAEEGSFVVLRLQFNIGDISTLSSTKPEGDDGKGPEDEGSPLFLRELTFRSKNTDLIQIFYNLQALRKEIAQRAKAQEVRDSLVEQEALRHLKDPSVRLRDVSIRPPISKARKSIGTVTAHHNGFRYLGSDQTYVDIIYNNIKSCFFKKGTATSEQIVIHIELKNPILLAKVSKKTNFIQFYVEVGEGIHDSGMSARGNDEDEMRAEQEEEIRRHKWNQKFKDFINTTQEQWANLNPGLRLSFETPIKNCTFQGAPNGREKCDIDCTMSALISLDTNPPMVVHMTDIDVAAFERMSVRLREFDITLLYNDFQRKQVITTVSKQERDKLMKYFEAMRVIVYECGDNLNWDLVLEDIRKDPKGFVEEGGWLNLLQQIDGGDEEEEDGEEAESEESESEYEADEDEEEEEDEDDSDDYVEDDESASDSEEEEEEEDSEDDWDKQEQKLRAEDKNRVAVGSKRKRDDSDSD